MKQTDLILVVEDEPRMRELITDYFTGKGTAAIGAENGSAALTILAQKTVSAILLDVMMPETDGFEVCRQLRSDMGRARFGSNCSAPVLFLSALGQEEDKLLGYQLGADDYITKPFSLAVLYAKTMVLLKRVRTDSHTPAAAALLLDENRRTAVIGGKEQKLPRKEFELLQYLVNHPNRLLTRDRLLEAVWGYDYAGEDRTVDNHIRKLRARGVVIETEYGVGYRYEP